MIRVIKHTERCKATCFTDSDPPPKKKRKSLSGKFVLPLTFLPEVCDIMIPKIVLLLPYGNQFS